MRWKQKVYYFIIKKQMLIVKPKVLLMQVCSNSGSIMMPILFSTCSHLFYFLSRDVRFPPPSHASPFTKMLNWQNGSEKKFFEDNYNSALGYLAFWYVLGIFGLLAHNTGFTNGKNSVDICWCEMNNSMQ